MSHGSRRLIIVREGFGEAGAIENLVVRVGKDIGVLPSVFPSIPPSSRYVISSAGRAVHAARIAAKQAPAAMKVAELRNAGLSSFRRLEAALTFLAREVESSGRGVYPGSAAGGG